MEKVFLFALTALTSVGAYLVGLKGYGLSDEALGAALSKMLACVGATLLFFITNLVIAVIIILTVRSLTGVFVSVYVVDEVVWLFFSLLQGLTFQWWRELSNRS